MVRGFFAFGIGESDTEQIDNQNVNWMKTTSIEQLIGSDSHSGIAGGHFKCNFTTLWREKLDQKGQQSAAFAVNPIISYKRTREISELIAPDDGIN